MSDQTSLFDEQAQMHTCPLCHGRGSVRHDDPTAARIGRWNRKGQLTQRNAAVDNYPRSGSQRGRILALIASVGPMTSDEAEHRLRLPHQSCSARFNELMNGGWIVDTNEKAMTRTGSEAILWDLSDLARWHR